MGLNFNLTPIQRCAAVSLICSIWNLFGDVCFIDFSLANMSSDGFGTINNEYRPSKLFDFSQNWPVQLAQAGGWMYPIWAVATTYPLYLGLEPSGKAFLPCALLAYGLCVVGGNLHAGFAFATILPKILHNSYQNDDNQNDDLYSTITFAQTEIMDCYVFGYTPGPIAVILSSGWILYIVITKETRFPRWFALCTPLVTLTLVILVGFLIMPQPFGFYFVGSFGTWIFLVMNAAASWVLWNDKSKIILQNLNDSYGEINGEAAVPLPSPAYTAYHN